MLSIQESVINHIEYTLARSRYRFNDNEAYQATGHSLRDRLIEAWNDTQTYFKEQNPKRVYYLSMEFLMGRSLLNTLYNLNVKDQYQEALKELGYDLEILAEQVGGARASAFLPAWSAVGLQAATAELLIQTTMLIQITI